MDLLDALIAVGLVLAGMLIQAYRTSRMTDVPLFKVLRGKQAAGGGPTNPTGPV